MQLNAKHFRLAGLCLCLFVAAQIFQALCFIFWIPETQAPAADFATRLGWMDRTRALAVLFGIVALAVTYAVIALDSFARAPLASLLGFTFTMFFVVFELLHRGLDFVLVSQQWAGQFAAATDPAVRDMLIGRLEFWGAFTGGIYFPLMLSGLVAWTCFAIATWRAGNGLLRLASIAFTINALRTLGRLLGSYTGIGWFDFLNDLSVYLVFVFLINTMLLVWLFRRSASTGKPAALSVS